MQKLPLFPLETVLFPSTPIQLHIFETRYLKMIQECLDKQLPFGVVLIRHGQEALGPLADPFQVGVTAMVAQVVAQDEQSLDLLAVGVDRFRVLQLDYTSQPYLQAEINPFPFERTDEGAVMAMRNSLEGLLTRYLELLKQAGAIQQSLDILPEDALNLGFLSAAVLQIPISEKQRLLEIESAENFLEALLATYRRENALLKASIDHKPVPDLRGFTAN